LKSYLASRFGLKSGVKPHELVFWMLTGS
jgi:hypothetical protein